MQSFREYSRKKLSLQINCSITDTRHVLNWILIIMNSFLRFYTLLALLNNIVRFLHDHTKTETFSVKVHGFRGELHSFKIVKETQLIDRYFLQRIYTIEWYVVTVIKGFSRQVKPTRTKSDLSTNNISKGVSLEFKLFALLYNL